MYSAILKGFTLCHMCQSTSTNTLWLGQYMGSFKKKSLKVIIVQWSFKFQSKSERIINSPRIWKELGNLANELMAVGFIAKLLISVHSSEGLTVNMDRGSDIFGLVVGAFHQLYLPHIVPTPVIKAKILIYVWSILCIKVVGFFILINILMIWHILALALISHGLEQLVCHV